jgi:hypothetical protein
MTPDPHTLSDALPQEQARVRAVLARYQSAGHHGAFGAAVIEGVLRRAEEAVASGDVVEMLRAYQDLKRCK